MESLICVLQFIARSWNCSARFSNNEVKRSKWVFTKFDFIFVMHGNHSSIPRLTSNIDSKRIFDYKVIEFEHRISRGTQSYWLSQEETMPFTVS